MLKVFTLYVLCCLSPHYPPAHSDWYRPPYGLFPNTSRLYLCCIISFFIADSDFARNGSQTNTSDPVVHRTSLEVLFFSERYPGNLPVPCYSSLLVVDSLNNFARSSAVSNLNSFKTWSRMCHAPSYLPNLVFIEQNVKKISS